MAALTMPIGLGASIFWLAMSPGLATAGTGIQALKNHGNYDVCLSSMGNKTAGAGVQDETCNGSNNQKWNIEETFQLGYYMLASVGSGGFCLNQPSPIQNYQLQDLEVCDGASIPQSWAIFGGAVDGGVTIRPVNDIPECLSSMGYGNGSEPLLFGCNGSPNQSWGTA